MPLQHRAAAVVSVAKRHRRPADCASAAKSSPIPSARARSRTCLLWFWSMWMGVRPGRTDTEVKIFVPMWWGRWFPELQKKSPRLPVTKTRSGRPTQHTVRRSLAPARRHPDLSSRHLHQRRRGIHRAQRLRPGLSRRPGHRCNDRHERRHPPQHRRQRFPHSSATDTTENVLPKRMNTLQACAASAITQTATAPFREMHRALRCPVPSPTRSTSFRQTARCSLKARRR